MKSIFRSLVRGILAAAVIYLAGLAISGLQGGGINSDLVRFTAGTRLMESIKVLMAVVLGLSFGMTTLNIMSFIALRRMEAEANEKPEDS